MLLTYRYLFNYSLMFVFLFGIVLYVYTLVIDSQTDDSDKRPVYETVWIWAMFIILILGFLLSSFSFS